MNDIFPLENMNIEDFHHFINTQRIYGGDAVLHKVIQPWDDTDILVKESFIKSHYWCGNASINIFKVVGTENPKYQGKTWLELINSDIKKDINIPLLIKNPTYYSEVKAKQPLMDFKTWDGINYYVNHRGNHRTALCQLYFYYTGETQIHGVTVEHFKLNESFYALYNEVTDFIKRHNLPITLNPVRECCGCDDTAGWKVDHYHTHVIWEEPGSTDAALTLTESELRAKFDQLKMSVSFE